MKFGGVDDCIVIVKENINDNLQKSDDLLVKYEYEKRLIAYFTSKHKILSTDLILFLNDILPSYSLPTFLVQIESLPLNINGKVDYESLPEPSLNAL
jgi:hypothetical protein